MLTNTRVYCCPHCAAELPREELDGGPERTTCRACGKPFIRWRLIQRQSADADFGQPPIGVRVEAGVMSPDRPCEDRIVYSRRKLFRILGNLGLVCFFGGMGVSDVLLSKWVAGLGCVALGLMGLVSLVCELFGKDVLHLYATEGVFVSGFGPWRKRIAFTLGPETYVRLDTYLKGSGLHANVPVRELLVVNGAHEEARFGRKLPLEVQEYFIKCIARRAAARALASAKGAVWRPEIAHPVVFALLLVAIVFGVAYGFSGHERITVKDGTVEIVESHWWVCRR